MEKVAFGYGNRIDEATLSGGSWQAPLSNIQTRRLAQKARSTTTATTDTVINIELPEPRLIQVIGIHAHNLSTDAEIEISAGTTLGGTDQYDVPSYDVWPSIYSTLSMHWTDYHFWSGKLDPETRKSYPSNLIHIVNTAVKSKYWTIKITDTNNDDGYIEIGRVFMGRLLQPKHNVIYGAEIGWEDNSEIEASLYGVEYYNDSPKTRVARVNYDYSDRTEALEGMFELQRLSGITKEVLFIGNTQDKKQMVRLGFLGRFRKIDPIKWHFMDIHSTGFEVKELL